MKYLGYWVSIFSVLVQIVLFSFGMVDILGFLISVIPLFANLAISLITERNNRNREKKIKSLRRMYEISKGLLAFFDDLMLRAGNQRRAGWVNPVNPSVEYAKMFNEVTPEILEFIELFRLIEQKNEILQMFRTNPTKTNTFLKEIENDLKLTDYERLLIEKNK